MTVLGCPAEGSRRRDDFSRRMRDENRDYQVSSDQCRSKIGTSSNETATCFCIPSSEYFTAGEGANYGDFRFRGSDGLA
jgi:hypothetical protein